jgi:hypothetical protein
VHVQIPHLNVVCDKIFLSKRCLGIFHNPWQNLTSLDGIEHSFNQIFIVCCNWNGLFFTIFLKKLTKIGMGLHNVIISIYSGIRLYKSTWSVANEHVL